MTCRFSASMIKSALFIMLMFATLGCGKTEIAMSDLGSDMSSPLACVDLSTLQSQESSQGVVSVLFNASDCESGAPVTELEGRDIIIRENGQERAGPGSVQLVTSRGSRVYVTLLLDMSGETAEGMPKLIEATKALVTTTLSDPSMAHVRIGVELFDGSRKTQTWALPTAELTTLIAKLEALADYSPPSPGATNLHGALAQSINELIERQQRVRQLNVMGVMTSGYVLLFSGGEDTLGTLSAAATTQQITAAQQYNASRATVQTLAVALESADDKAQSLVGLVGEQGHVFKASAPDKLSEAFAQVGDLLRAKIGATYLLSYCALTNEDVGDSTAASVEVMSERYQAGRAATFTSMNFKGICSDQWLQNACQGKNCGTTTCGGCDDATEVCSGEESGQCVDACLDQGKCGGELITNALGYELVCQADEELGSCADQCVDLMGDDAHCGACGHACEGGMFCQEGVCVGGVQLSIKGQTACLLSAQGDVRYWGKQEFGFGHGGEFKQTTSIRVPELSLMESMEMGSCAMRFDGTVQCWGRYKVEGYESPEIFRPETVKLANIKSFAMGQQHQCFLLHSGEVYCSGVNEYGQLGNGTTQGSDTPTKVAGLEDVEQLALMSHQSCALVKGGAVYCWGLASKEYNPMIQRDDFTLHKTPQLMADLTAVKQLKSHDMYACALLVDGTVYCWGTESSYGRLTQGKKDYLEVYHVGVVDAETLFVAQNHSCAIQRDTTVSCWGDNYSGQLGDGTRRSTLSAVKVAGLSGVQSLAMAPYHTCALLADKTAQCWGYNGQGQLGDGTVVDQSSPTIVSGLSDIKQLALGYSFSCALLSDGPVYCWGYNRYGGLGVGEDILTSTTPIPIK